MSRKNVSQAARHVHQRGVTLFIVVVFVMLSTLLALWASRTAWIGELVVGNDVDYQRAFEAAQALLQDAELDIRGETSSGGKCLRSTGSTNTKICRFDTVLQFPLETKDVRPLLNFVASASSVTKCSNGICVKRSDPQDFWNNNDQSQGLTLAQMTATGVGARYGQFTGAESGANSNPILSATAAGTGGWYWVEVMKYKDSANNASLITNMSSNTLALNLNPSVLYRITAVAHGLKPSTLVVLQQTYARQKLKD